MKLSVGLIGLGLMGRPIGANLLKAGFPLTVWNRTASRADGLVALGARAAKTPREAAAASDVLITIVSDPPALEQVLWGSEGALDGLRRGSVLVDSSTVSPALERRVASACAERGVEFLDAPVTGGTWGAEKGELVIMVGGLQETLSRVEPVFGAIAKRWFHLGPNGAGQTVSGLDQGPRLARLRLLQPRHSRSERGGMRVVPRPGRQDAPGVEGRADDHGMVPGVSPAPGAASAGQERRLPHGPGPLDARTASERA